MPESDDETWAPVPGYEGLYEVSTKGRVRRLEAEVDGPHGPDSRTQPATILSPAGEGIGSRVQLWKNGDHTTRMVARLMLIAFERPPDEPTRQARQKDPDAPLHIDNLEWGRPITQAKLTEEQALSIWREAWAADNDPAVTNADIGRRYGISAGAVSHIKNGRSWDHATPDTPPASDDE